jgi:hypothetical protein
MMGPPWYLTGVVDELGAALAALEQAHRDEAAPHGIDEWDERPLQLALADALRGTFAVTLEAPYPSLVVRDRRRGRRCDLVLAAPDTSPEAEPERALWLELKLARQRRAGGDRDPRYAEQWRRQLVADLRKLAAEPRIHAGAIVLVAFTEDEAALERDLEGFESVMVQRGVVAGFRQVRTVPVVDRIGHRVGAIAAWPTVQNASPPGATW